MGAKRKRAVVVDAGRAESPKEPVDREVEEEFYEAGQMGRSPGDLVRRLKENTDRSPELTAGDPDAAWDQADSGEETVGGDNPTPDQSDVDEIGRAAGIVYGEAEPLHTLEKLEQRDKKRPELDPAFSEDYRRRRR